MNRCPFCGLPPEEHEILPGRLCWVYVCPNAPTGWRGVFTDHPVDGEPPFANLSQSTP